MDTALGIILLSGMMLVGSFLAGSIPLVMQMSEDRMHFISVMGAGLLVGTALSVIIPEGIHTIYLAHIHNVQNAQGMSESQLVKVNAEHMASPVPAIPQHSDHENHDIRVEENPFQSVGPVIVLGFCFMLLVDQCSRRGSGGFSRDVESLGSIPKRSLTATLGLVVHAAADGIGLGAAATTTQRDVEMIVFIAIMLHKAPAAFGLVSFLLHEGLDRHTVRKHLAIFAFAAPVMAVVTYFVISQDGKQNAMGATSTAMLFSGGTFLYVATVHVLPEVTKDSHNGFSGKELLGLVAGVLLPLLITAGHQH